ncbi:MAG: hypothetical protein P8Y75_05865 [Nitrospirota bacterium]
MMKFSSTTPTWPAMVRAARSSWLLRKSVSSSLSRRKISNRSGEEAFDPLGLAGQKFPPGQDAVAGVLRPDEGRGIEHFSPGKHHDGRGQGRGTEGGLYVVPGQRIDEEIGPGDVLYRDILPKSVVLQGVGQDDVVNGAPSGHPYGLAPELNEHVPQVLPLGMALKVGPPHHDRALLVASGHAEDVRSPGYSHDGGRKAHVPQVELSLFHGLDDGRTGPEELPLGLLAQVFG